MSNGSALQVSRILDMPGLAVQPALSALTSCRLWFDGTDLQLSENGGAFVPIITVGGSGWTDLGGTVVLTTPADDVGIGGNPLGTEKLFVVDTPAAGATQAVNALALGDGARTACVRASRTRGAVGLLAAEPIFGFITFPVGLAADDAAAQLIAYKADEPALGGSPAQTSAFLVRGSDGGGNDYDFGLLGENQILTISTFRSSAGNAYDLRLFGGDETGGDDGSDVVIAGGTATGVGTPGSAQVVARQVDQPALQVRAFVPAGTADPLAVFNFNSREAFKVLPGGNSRCSPSGSGAGANSFNFGYECETSAGARTVFMLADGDVATDTKRLKVNDDVNGLMVDFEATATLNIWRWKNGNELQIQDDLGTPIIRATDTEIAFHNVAPAALSAAYTVTNVTPDRSYDADAATVAEIADVLGTVIADLQLKGLLG